MKWNSMGKIQELGLLHNCGLRELEYYIMLSYYFDDKIYNIFMLRNTCKVLR